MTVRLQILMNNLHNMQMKILFLYLFIISTKEDAFNGKIKVKLDRYELVYVNQSYSKNVKVQSYMFNRTTRALRTQFTLLKGFDKSTTKFHCEVAQFISNEYRLGAIQFADTAYNMMTGKYGKKADILTTPFCKPNISWPIIPQIFYRCNDIVIDSSTLKLFPIFAGKWKVTLIVTNNQDKIFHGHVYVILEVEY